MPTIHNIPYEFYSWAELGEDIFELSKKILESGQEFDRIVALAKGGLAFSRSLVDYLKVDNVSSIQIEMYAGINEVQHLPVITQSLPTSIRHEKILVFDDLADSGETLKLAVDYLKHHGPKSVHTATLMVKPHTVFTPDFWVRETSAWVIFPNEVRETITQLVGMWTKNGDDTATIQRQLTQIGLPAKEIAFFLEKLP